MFPRFRWLVIGAILLAVGGSVYAWGTFLRPEENGGLGSDRHSHSHADLDPVSANRPYPTLDVTLKTEGSQRVLYLDTENFTFKSAVDTDVEGPNVGHAHLFVDGESIAMFYADRYVLPDFMPGRYTLKITLNQDKTHAPFSARGTVVADTMTLTVREENQKQ
jgi:hypothetical protein